MYKYAYDLAIVAFCLGTIYGMAMFLLWYWCNCSLRSPPYRRVTQWDRVQDGCVNVALDCGHGFRLTGVVDCAPRSTFPCLACGERSVV